ncbi:DUF1269 domain-containing protein [Conyzicola nivalis]|nr:DUF1269 domain-containing protein [Conyzicola nivalis]
MATLSVWKFDTATGADDAGRTLQALHDRALITVHDAAVVSWAADDKKPKTRSLDESIGALGGAFWGFLLGLIFFVPLLGTAIGLATGALTASLRDVGIDDAFIDRVRESVTPGTSALFVLSSDAVTDEVRKAFAGTEMELIETNLSADDERALREAFVG